jgi:hypothetical protein
VQGLVAAEAARMSLEEEVNQSVSRAVSLAEAAEAASAGADEDGKEDDRDLATLAPPAAETVAAGTAAPQRVEDDHQPFPRRSGLGGRPGMHAAQEPAPDPFDGPVPVGGGMMPPGGGRGPNGRQGTTPPPPPSLADRASRFGGPQDGPPRPSLPLPSGAPISGLGDPTADREPKREQPNRTGLIDPDEPTEGIRLL